MTKRYYIDNEVQGLIAVRFQGFKLVTSDGLPVIVSSSGFSVDAGIDKDFGQVYTMTEKAYIAEESLHLLEPQSKDFIIDYDNEPRNIVKVQNGKVLWLEDEGYGYCYIDDITIIQRNGKPFPEIKWEEV